MNPLKSLATLAVATQLTLVCGITTASAKQPLLLVVNPPGAAATTSTSATAGETFSHEAGGLEFELPDGWEAEPDGETISVSTPDDTLKMIFWVADEDTFEEAAKALDEEIAKTVKNMKTVGEPTEDTHNGMPHYSESGTGEVEGATIQWSVDLLMAKKPVIILSFAAPGLWGKHQAELEKLVASIKKTD